PTYRVPCPSKGQGHESPSPPTRGHAPPVCTLVHCTFSLRGAGSQYVVIREILNIMHRRSGVIREIVSIIPRLNQRATGGDHRIE
ncbi:MAG: hypothetical protein ACKPKO_15160, partial [Candidatus Fonsibacter sp.]